jgi:hypothetical protein
MNADKLQIITTHLLSAYIKDAPKDLQKAFDALHDEEDF